MIFFYVFLVFAGVINAVQSGSSNTLHKNLQHPLLPAVVTFAGGFATVFLAFAVYTFSTKAPLPTARQWSSIPWWASIAGVMGSVYVISQTNVSGKVGAGVFAGITVTSAIVTSILLDHFGLLGFERHTASFPRLIGGALMIAGIVLVGKF